MAPKQRQGAVAPEEPRVAVTPKEPQPGSAMRLSTSKILQRGPDTTPPQAPKDKARGPVEVEKSLVQTGVKTDGTVLDFMADKQITTRESEQVALLTEVEHLKQNVSERDQHQDPPAGNN